MDMMRNAARRRPWVVGLAIALLLAGCILAAVSAFAVGPSASPDGLRLTYPSDFGNNSQQLIAIDGRTDGRNVGTPANFTSVRISPDGSYIAALTGPQGMDYRAHLHLIEWATGAETLVELDGSTNLIGIAWSSASDVVAIAGQTSYLVALGGTIIAAANPPVPPGYANRIDGGGFDWSPDGQLFVSIANGSVTYLRRGSGRFVEGSSITTGDGNALSLVGWVGNHAPVLEYAEERIVVDMREDTPNLTPVGNREVSPLSGLRPVSEKARGMAFEESSGMRKAWSRLNTAGDYIVEFREPGDRARVAVVSADGERVEAADLGYPANLVRDGSLVDAVLVGE